MKSKSKFKNGLVVGLAGGILLSVTSATALLRYGEVELVIKPEPKFEELKMDRQQRDTNIPAATALAQAGGYDADTDETTRRVDHHRR